MTNTAAEDLRKICSTQHGSRVPRSQTVKVLGPHAREPGEHEESGLLTLFAPSIREQDVRENVFCPEVCDERSSTYECVVET